VSLLRSCYSTRMRFFSNDLTIETPVLWYFTEPGAKWCGLPNVFNSRNWYGGTTGWPDLGEVEGAPRPWADGSGLCHGHFGPFGTAGQWEEGARTSEAIVDNPCTYPPDLLGWSDIAMNITVSPQTSVDMTRYGDNWSIPYPDRVLGPDWFTVTKKKGPVCCFADGATVAITGPPPLFPVIRVPDITDFPFNGCTVEGFFDPVEGLNVQIISNLG
jgi:hypothetical protein